MNISKGKTNIFFSAIFNALLILFIFFSAIVLGFYLTHDYYNVDGVSMQPTILEGQAVFASMGENYTYGDIVIGYNLNSVKIVKRVIGLGGDKISLVLNDEGYYDTLIIYKNTSQIVVLQENYVVNKISGGIWSDISTNINYSNYYDYFINKLSNQKTFEEIEYNTEIKKFLVIPENSVFLLGDNRFNSVDCATYGSLECSSIVGKVKMIVNQNDYYVFDILLYSFGLRSMYQWK